MKGILIATAMATVYFIAVTIAFRTLDVRRRAAFMVGVWLVTLPAFVMLHQLTPADLGSSACIADRAVGIQPT